MGCMVGTIKVFLFNAYDDGIVLFRKIMMGNIRRGVEPKDWSKALGSCCTQMIL